MSILRRVIGCCRRWEERITKRVRGWPIGQRWLVFVLIPALACCGGGAVVGVPLMWAIGVTQQASNGAANPEAAVNVYLLALSYQDDAGLLPVLDNDHGDELMKQWHGYIAEMHRGNTRPAKLEFTFTGSRSVGRGHVEVDASVWPVWWGGDGQTINSAGERHIWRFSTHDNRGWQIDAVTPHAWCSGYVTTEACQGVR